MKNLVFGIDIGGTGIKGGIVNVKKGRMETERIKIPTPKPATPASVASACVSLLKKFDWKGPVGCGFPSIIKHNVCFTATNIDQSWIGVDVSALLKKHTGLTVQVVNDADAAALCEVGFGAAKNKKGLVMMITVGTGIGCGMVYNGVLIPNCELGVAYMKGDIILEKYCSNSARKIKKLDWKDYAKRLNRGLEYIDRLTSPDLFVIGGGMTKHFDLLKPAFNPKLNIKPAQFQNEAGTIGAALAYTVE